MKLSYAEWGYISHEWGGSLGKICSCYPNRLDSSFAKPFSPPITSTLNLWDYGDNPVSVIKIVEKYF